MIAGYQLLGLIGAGAMGEVYEAQHHPSHRRVAIKVLREKTDDSVNAGRRLIEEARAVIAIRHPGIVMELLAGLPLSVHLKQRKLPVADIVMVLDGILDALNAAHRAGVIHRDLKPSNVFILAGDRPRVKLLDFGVARREGDRADRRTKQDDHRLLRQSSSPTSDFVEQVDVPLEKIPDQTLERHRAGHAVDRRHPAAGRR